MGIADLGTGSLEGKNSRTTPSSLQGWLGGQGPLCFGGFRLISRREKEVMQDGTLSGCR